MAEETAARVRLALQEEIDRHVPDNVWADLVARGRDAAVLAGELTIEALGDQVFDLFELRNIHPGRRARTPAALARVTAASSGALSDLAAAQATDQQGVVDFRRIVLGDTLLPLDGVEPWIKRQAELDGPPTTWIAVPLPPGYEPDLVDTGSGPGLTIVNPPPEFTAAWPMTAKSIEALAYGVPGHRGVFRRATAAGGVLNQLHHLSKDLAQRYGWQEALATLFVLTGRTPMLTLLAFSIRMNHPSVFASRIEISVDPTVSPEELAHAYGRLRRQLIGGPHRELSEKHAELGVFAARHTLGKWAERMRTWNKAYPRRGPRAAWRYSSVRLFARDCREAHRRLHEGAFPPARWPYASAAGENDPGKEKP